MLQTLATAPSSSGDDSEQPNDSTEGTAQRKRILIIEDELLIAMEFEDALAHAGYACVGIAPDERRAIMLAERERPHLALVDIRLRRNADGIEIAKKLLDRYAVRSIFISAHLDAETRQRAGDVAPLAMLHKPIEGSSVVKAVASALSRLSSHGGPEG